MIAKYPSSCRYCRKPIEVGRDEYELESKTSYHLECHESQPPGPEQYAKASELGFVPSADIGSVSWVAVCQDWTMRHLSAGIVRETAGRSGPESRGRNTSLFGEE